MSCPYSLKLIHVLSMHGFLLLGAAHQGNIIFIDFFIVNFNMYCIGKAGTRNYASLMSHFMETHTHFPFNVSHTAQCNVNA